MDQTPAGHFAAALSALDGIADPCERAVQGHELQRAMQAATPRIRATVDGAVAALRPGVTLAQIATLLGVSVQRAGQIATSRHHSAKPQRTAGDDQAPA